jgi:MFS superfamily sulfate permease-like transporter
MFKSTILVNKKDENTYVVDMQNAAVFSNYIGLLTQFEQIPKGKKVIVDFTHTKLVDHTVFEGIHHLSNDYKLDNGEFDIIGLEGFTNLSDHPMAARYRK